MGRSPCCDKNGLKKGPWTQEEDLKLMEYIQLHGPGNWRTLPKNAGNNPTVFNFLFLCLFMEKIFWNFFRMMKYFY